MNSYEMYIYTQIQEKIKNRKLVLRYKNSQFEDGLFKHTGIKADFYVTRNIGRVDNSETFLDEELKGKSKEYFLVILPELPFNEADNNRYIGMGYVPEEDFIWMSHKEMRYSIERELIKTDCYGNEIECHSKVNISIMGGGNKVFIGKNVKIPANLILKVGSNVNVYIDDNVLFNPKSIILQNGTSLCVGKNTKIEGMFIFINTDSVLKIGMDNTISTGRIQTGRNQTIEVGNDCMFSWDIVLLGSDGHLIWDLNSQKALNNTDIHRNSIKVDDHVWIGGETVILPCTHIGSGSVCAYRSLIKGDQPSQCILGGSPAKPIKKNIAWSRSNYTSCETDDFLAIPDEYRRFISD